MKLKLFFLSSTVLGVALGGPAAFAADLPLPAVDTVLRAVSAPNGKIAVFGGGFDGDADSGALYGLDTSFSLPLGDRFGLQLDTLVSGLDGEFAGGAGGHLFWRDPSRGLFGLYGDWSRNDLANLDAMHVAFEAEAYIGRISLEGLIGWENRDFDAGGDDDDIFALADIALYATDNLRVSVGYRHVNDLHTAALGAEYQLPVSWAYGTPSVFGEVRVAEDGNVAGWGGLRLAIGGGDKSLIRHHREDDPRSRISELFAGAGQGNGGAATPGIVCPDFFVLVEGVCVPTS